MHPQERECEPQWESPPPRFGPDSRCRPISRGATGRFPGPDKESCAALTNIPRAPDGREPVGTVPLSTDPGGTAIPWARTAFPRHAAWQPSLKPEARHVGNQAGRRCRRTTPPSGIDAKGSPGQNRPVVPPLPERPPSHSPPRAGAPIVSGRQAAHGKRVDEKPNTLLGW